MSVDTKQPKGYRKAWNGSQSADSLGPEPVERPLGWCRDTRLACGQDVVVEQTTDFTLVRCVGEFGPRNIHAGKWILWGPNGRCAAIGNETWTRKIMAQEIEKRGGNAEAQDATK